ncbi:MAG TPA: phosphatidate cytidylyltransferase, partial [Methylomirabilota bacterium]|nr:phosphatidate cytidylyltransferase [Methylomirabilota bacterium]
PSVTTTVTGAPTAAVQRVLTAVVFLPPFLWMVSRGPGWVFVLFVMAVSGLALWELLRLFQGAGWPVYTRTAIALGVVVTGSFALPAPAVVPSAFLCLAAAVLLSAPLWSGTPPQAEPAALTLVSLVYVSWFLGHVLALHRRPEGDFLVLFLVTVTWLGETAAYVVGSTVGRHRLAPAVSPRKTIEGAVAQLVASVAGAGLFAAWLLPAWSLAGALVAGSILGVVGQVGDLVESVMKRSVGVKDAGGLIPGHGGVLDRIDGLLFNTPALYYYVTLGGATLGGAPALAASS